VQKMIPPKQGGKNCPRQADLPVGKKKDVHTLNFVRPAKKEKNMQEIIILAAGVAAAASLRQQ
jgi:hypothetical protein